MQVAATYARNHLDYYVDANKHNISVFPVLRTRTKIILVLAIFI